MIKIFIEDNYDLIRSNKWNYLLKYSKDFEKYGIKLVDNIKNCDIILCNYVRAELLYLKKKIIICERIDCTPLDKSYYHIDNPLVIGIFKEFISRNKSLQNNNTYCNRIHYKIINDIYKITEHVDDKRIIKNNLHKIKCVPWNWHQYTHLSCNSNMLKCKELFKIKKTLDVFCVCHPHLHSAILSKHRKEVVKIVKSMGKKIKVFTNVIETHDEYNQTLSKYKICVAPWGIGERIALDQKAILAGCVLIKPDSDYVKSYPDLYQEQYYVKCKQDLSNLKNVINSVLKNYKFYYNKTCVARKMLLEYDEHKFVEHFCENIKSCTN